MHMPHQIPSSKNPILGKVMVKYPITAPHNIAIKMVIQIYWSVPLGLTTD